MPSILEQYDLRQHGNLDLMARQVVEGFIIGLHKSPFHGFSVEFAEHRIYNQGDSTKNIDWKVYARTDRLYSKQFEEETNLRCQIVVDISSSMYFPEAPKASKTPHLNKLAFSALAAGSLVHLLQKQRDAYGLSVFGEEVELHTPCKSSSKHRHLLFSYIEQYLNQKSRQKGTNAAQALHEIAERIHRRSLVVIFSDMFEDGDGEELFSALQHLKYNKHEVILFHVVDKRYELDFEFENRPYQFIDIETGEKLKLQPNQLKDFYKQQVKKYKEALKLKCLQYKIDFVEADIQEDFRQVLLPYLVKRSKMR
ncbi:hypothetical protein SapgrDRAFT_2751 [Saprospira grandis DSM 2844]|uniref:DUF58 domain-containing protein n=1 Tax=Saprospira grandis DSM 2844 TaxID=694433 RepID=J0XZ04_9BACT|nr:DUF58 domain-containing protein [Saprospira grandis]EJF54406.1 hypothetical protein SapgrDRAFT_2751 [Saprospira grandis DSM 2844]